MVDIESVLRVLDRERCSSFPGDGGLFGGFTLEAHRGRGLYRATVAERARDALRLGARHLRVDALPTSEPILQRLGFVKVADTWPCVLAAISLEP